jgi:hypothetical protein
MALPSSGQLSFSAIAGELGASTPYSLSGMSIQAGFNSPYNVSSFYGFSPGGQVVSISLSFSKSDKEVCLFKTSTFYSDDSDFSKSTALYLDSKGDELASAGYYSDLKIIRFWTGESFDTKYEGTCKL